jgi:hypothetical protein
MELFMPKYSNATMLMSLLLFFACLTKAADHRPTHQKTTLTFGAVLSAAGEWLLYKSFKKQKKQNVPEPEIYQLQKSRKNEVVSVFRKLNMPDVLTLIVVGYDQQKTFEQVCQKTKLAPHPRGKVQIYTESHSGSILKLRSVDLEAHDTFESIQEKIAQVGFPVEMQKIWLSGKRVNSIDDLHNVLTIGTIRVDA